MSLSVLISNIQVTGSAILYSANLSGIGGAQVIQSGNYILISGGAGGGNTGNGVTQAQLDSLSGFTTGISGYLQNQISMSSAGVSSLNGISGSINIIGSGGVSVINNGQRIIISGNDWATSGNLAASGSLLYTLIVNSSGVLSTSIAFTGQQMLSIIQQTGSLLYNLIVNQSGNFLPTGSILSYVTGIATGFDSGWYGFKNYIFPSVPSVQATLETTNNSCIYGFMISGRSTSGFFAWFTDTIFESGYQFNVLAKV